MKMFRLHHRQRWMRQQFIIISDNACFPPSFLPSAFRLWKWNYRNLPFNGMKNGMKYPRISNNSGTKWLTKDPFQPHKKNTKQLTLSKNKTLPRFAAYTVQNSIQITQQLASFSLILALFITLLFLWYIHIIPNILNVPWLMIIEPVPQNCPRPGSCEKDHSTRCCDL